MNRDHYNSKRLEENEMKCRGLHRVLANSQHENLSTSCFLTSRDLDKTQAPFSEALNSIVFPFNSVKKITISRCLKVTHCFFWGKTRNPESDFIISRSTHGSWPRATSQRRPIDWVTWTQKRSMYWRRGVGYRGACKDGEGKWNFFDGRVMMVIEWWWWWWWHADDHDDQRRCRQRS